MKYKIELLCGAGTSNEHWERSWCYPKEYTRAEATAIFAEKFNQQYQWRMRPLTYRRHAAITPLELRGAIQMLTNARQHLVSDVNSSDEGLAAFVAFQVITHARMECVRALETM
jgi:hypothetical protein